MFELQLLDRNRRAEDELLGYVDRQTRWKGDTFFDGAEDKFFLKARKWSRSFAIQHGQMEPDDSGYVIYLSSTRVVSFLMPMTELLWVFLPSLFPLLAKTASPTT